MLSYFTAVSSGTSRDRVKVPDVDSHNWPSQCRCRATWNSCEHTHTHSHIVTQNTTLTHTLSCLSHPACLPLYHLQLLSRFGLPWQQGGKWWWCCGGNGDWLSGGRGGGSGWGLWLRWGGVGQLQFNSQEVRENLITPLPLVAFGALTYVRWLRVLHYVSAAAVSM